MAKAEPAWWVRDIVIAVALGSFFLALQFWSDEKRADETDELAESLAEAAERQEARRTLESERLENLRFVRSSSGPRSTYYQRPFAGLDLNEQSISSLQLRQSNFEGATLLKVDASFSDMSRSSFTLAEMNGAKLEASELNGAVFVGASMRDANLRLASAREADFSGADLAGSTLLDARLSGANFYQTDLFNADLRGADARGAEFGEAKLDGADLRGADLSKALGLRRASLASACFDATTLLPTWIDNPEPSNSCKNALSPLESLARSRSESTRD